MRFFNTTAPVVAEDRDCIPPLKRLDLAGIRRLIREKRYFIFHAPRQTGKTSRHSSLESPLTSVRGADVQGCDRVQNFARDFGADHC